MLNTKKFLFISIIVYNLLLIYFLGSITQNYLLEIPEGSPFTILTSLLISLSCFGLIDAKNRHNSIISNYFFTFQVLFIVVPASSFVSIQPSYSFFLVLLIVVVLYTVKFMTSALQKVSTDLRFSILLSKYLSTFVLIVFGLVVIISYFLCVKLFLIRGINLDILFSFVDLYDLRDEVFNSYKTIDFFIFYFLGYFVNPLLLIHSSRTKSPFVLLISLLSICIVFFATAMKTYIFIPFLVVFSFYVIRRFNALVLFNSIAVIIIVLLVFGTIPSKSLGLEIYAQLLARTIVEPGRLHILWIDYFQDIPVENIFDLNPKPLPMFGGKVRSEVIADFLGGSTGNGEGANAGFIASSFSTYGILGLIIHVVCFSWILAFLNFKFNDLKMKWLVGVSLASLYLLTNVSFIGVVFYYGLGITCFSLILKNIKFKII